MFQYNIALSLDFKYNIALSLGLSIHSIKVRFKYNIG